MFLEEHSGLAEEINGSSYLTIKQIKIWKVMA
jgi:hypothetical protein